MYIPKYFTLYELTKSATAQLNNVDNTPTFEIVDNLKELCRLILDPVRLQFGKPIYISSGYRCAKLNKLVGGVKNSQHLTGCAADLIVNDLRGLFDVVKENPYIDQLLFESNGKTQWLHVSFAPNGKPRHYINNNYKAK